MIVYTRTYRNGQKHIKEVSYYHDYSYCFYIYYTYPPTTKMPERVRGIRRPYMFKGKVISVTVSTEDSTNRIIRYNDEPYDLVYYISRFNSFAELLKHIQVELSTEDWDTINKNYLLEAVL